MLQIKSSQFESVAFQSKPFWGSKIPRRTLRVKPLLNISLCDVTLKKWRNSKHFLIKKDVEILILISKY